MNLRNMNYKKIYMTLLAFGLIFSANVAYAQDNLEPVENQVQEETVQEEAPVETDSEIVDYVSETVEIPMQTSVIYTNELQEGLVEVVIEGKPGLKSVTRDQDGNIISETIIEEMVVRVEKHGTLQSQEGKESYEDIGFETIIRNNPSLANGIINVIQEGKLGLKLVTRDSDGNILTEEVIENPINRIEEHGTRVDQSTEESGNETEEPGTGDQSNPGNQPGDQQVENPGQAEAPSRPYTPPNPYLPGMTNNSSSQDETQDEETSQEDSKNGPEDNPVTNDLGFVNNLAMIGLASASSLVLKRKKNNLG